MSEEWVCCECNATRESGTGPAADLPDFCEECAAIERARKSGALAGWLRRGAEELAMVHREISAQVRAERERPRAPSTYDTTGKSLGGDA